jgi:hypothetical protein
VRFTNITIPPCSLPVPTLKLSLRSLAYMLMCYCTSTNTLGLLRWLRANRALRLSENFLPFFTRAPNASCVLVQTSHPCNVCHVSGLVRILPPSRIFPLSPPETYVVALTHTSLHLSVPLRQKWGSIHFRSKTPGAFFQPSSETLVNRKRGAYFLWIALPAGHPHSVQQGLMKNSAVKQGGGEGRESGAEGEKWRQGGSDFRWESEKASLSTLFTNVHEN